MSSTPGPWHVGGKDQTIIFADDGYAIADAKTYHGKHRDGSAQGNAHLMATAPDLLEENRQNLDLLTGLDGYFEEGSHEAKVIKQRIAATRAAIAKATGGGDA